MQLTLISARDPSWANAEHTVINLFVKFQENVDQLGEMEFSAASYDIEPHGRDIFERAKAGEFGPVAEYVVTPERAKMLIQLRNTEANTKVNALQSEVNILQDAVDLEMATEEEVARLAAAKTELTAWKRYRVLLSRIEAQAGFPTVIEWPEKPA
jgi:hypothetical protein